MFSGLLSYFPNLSNWVQSFRNFSLSPKLKASSLFFQIERYGKITREVEGLFQILA